MATLTRYQMYGLIHKGAMKLPGIDDDDAYRDWLELKTRTEKRAGKRSCKDLSDTQLSRLVDDLRDLGALDGPSRGGKGNGKDRPTKAQWAKLAALARAKRGWEKGLEDPRLKAFVERTAKVSSPRFLTRAGATKCITGLEQWESKQWEPKQ